MPRLMIWNGQARIVPKHVAYAADDAKVKAAMIKKYGPQKPKPATPRKRKRKRKARLFQELDKMPSPPPALDNPASLNYRGYAGLKVWSRDKKMIGRATGTVRQCRQVEACRGKQIQVAWPDARFSWPCTRGMAPYKNGWKIL